MFQAPKHGRVAGFCHLARQMTPCAIGFHNSKSKLKKLKEIRQFLASDYRWKHLEDSSLISTHCCNYALASPHSCFTTTCDHVHSNTCVECNMWPTSIKEMRWELEEIRGNAASDEDGWQRWYEENDIDWEVHGIPQGLVYGCQGWSDWRRNLTSAAASSPAVAPVDSAANAPINIPAIAPINSLADAPINSQADAPINSQADAPINSLADASFNNPADAPINSQADAPFNSQADALAQPSAGGRRTFDARH